VRIPFAVGKCVVLAVAGDPLLGDDRRRKPEPQPHRQRREVVQLDPAMRLGAVQEQRDGNVGEVTRDDDEYERLPPRRRPASKIRHFLLLQFDTGIGYGCNLSGGHP
jgi:hypothetical protein